MLDFLLFCLFRWETWIKHWSVSCGEWVKDTYEVLHNRIMSRVLYLRCLIWLMGLSFQEDIDVNPFKASHLWKSLIFKQLKEIRKFLVLIRFLLEVNWAPQELVTYLRLYQKISQLSYTLHCESYFRLSSLFKKIKKIFTFVEISFEVLNEKGFDLLVLSVMRFF